MGVAAVAVVCVVDVCAGALLLDADDWRGDGRVGVEVRALPLDDHLLRPLRDRLCALKGENGNPLCTYQIILMTLTNSDPDERSDK